MFAKIMNCFVCAKKKEDYEVWTNKIVIGATYDSEFQNNDIIRNLSDKSVICHVCIKTIEKEVEDKRKI
jgi:hypothetical protein